MSNQRAEYTAVQTDLSVIVTRTFPALGLTIYQKHFVGDDSRTLQRSQLDLGMNEKERKTRLRKRG